MRFISNIKAKIDLDRFLQNLLSTVNEPPKREWLNMILLKKLLKKTEEYTSAN
jgi:hypothetical protein